MSKPKNIETVLQNDIQKINMNEKIVETNSMLEDIINILYLFVNMVD